MEYLWVVIYILFMAFCNRARGTCLFNNTDSTVLGRLVATFGMAFATSWMLLQHDSFSFFATMLFWSWATLMVWCTPGWDIYWGACIGDPPTRTTGWPPVDWIMKTFFPPLPTHDCPYMRIWGIIAMGLRQSLMDIWLIGLACLLKDYSHLYAIMLPLFFGIWYFIGSLVYKPNAVGIGEYCIGASMGVTCLILHMA